MMVTIVMELKLVLQAAVWPAQLRFATMETLAQLILATLA